MYINFFAKNFGYSLEYPCIHGRPAPALLRCFTVVLPIDGMEHAEESCSL